LKTFCTLSDKNYLPLGKALVQSLSKHTKSDWRMYYLCLDEETFKEVSNLDKVVAIPLRKVEESNKDLVRYKETAAYNEYCWSLASAFCKYILSFESVDHVMYIDSDIFFYKDPQIIFDEQGSKSIGIIRHRHNTSSSPDGEYNVGVVFFRNDPPGRACVAWWNNAIVNRTNPELATCGDQKYLEKFYEMFPSSTKILDETFAHTAPWNFRLYIYDNYFSKGTLIWGDKEQPLVFNHFSRIKITEQGIDPTGGHYADHTLGFQVFNIPAVRHMYLEYAREIGKEEVSS